ncbi:MAG: hypothetical protein K9G13_00745 [Aquiluna sp.]|nr:hypothetical protein [Aquiluna sp.]MCF8545062.1 hypothetical protein [Aquiluna sp.]
MRKQLFLITSASLAWWITINLTWVTVGDKDFTGGNLSPVLNLMPGIALLMIFISAYGRLRRSLLIGISLIAGYAGYLSFFTYWIGSSVVKAEFERLTGIAGGDHSALNVATGISAAPTASAALACLVAGLAIYSSARKPAQTKRRSSEVEVDYEPDNRALWDEQEN